MHQAKHRILVNAAKMMDIVVLLFCFCAVTIYLSALTLTPTSLQQFLSMRIRLGNFLIWVGIVIVWHYVLELSGLYMSKRLSTRRSKLSDVVQATSVVAAFLYLTGLLFHLRLIKPTFVLIFWILSTLLLAGGRLMIWIILGKLRMRGLNPKKENCRDSAVAIPEVRLSYLLCTRENILENSPRLKPSLVTARCLLHHHLPFPAGELRR